MISSSVVMAMATMLLAATTTVADPIARPVPHGVNLVSRAETSMGCYSSSQSLTFSNTYQYQSSGECAKSCIALTKTVIAINGTDCWCGATLPPLAAKVDDTNCNTVCPGYGQVNCGSSGGAKSYWTVWNDGLQSTVSNSGDAVSSVAASSSSTASPSKTPTSSANPSVVTVGGQTVVVTASSAPSSSPSASGEVSASSGPNKAAIAAGVVVGVVAIAAIAGGVWFFIRAKRRREVEEEYKRQVAISAFVAGGKPGSSGSHNTHDTRLDPVIMTQRRMSDGSIADNQDYSRRILKVTNA